MICKNCGKALEAEETVCIQCGYDNGTEAEERKGKINPWKIAFPATVSLGLLLVLSWLLFYGVNGYWLPRANDIYNKDSYTVSDERLAFSRDTVVATLGKHKLTNAQLRVFYSRLCADYKGEYSSSKPLEEQIYDENTGLTWEQYLLEMSLNTWKQYRILTDMALETGFELPEEYRASLDGMEKTLAASAEKYEYASVEEMLSDDICKGCTVADYRYFMELFYYANLYYEQLAGKLEVNNDEIEAYFAANKEQLKENGITKDSGFLVDFRHILLKPEGESDSISSAQWENCKLTAEKLLDEWIGLGATEEAFSNLASQKSQDTNTKNNGGLLSFIYKDYLTKVDVRHILIMPEGGTKGPDGKTTVYSEAEWETCRKKAQEVYDEYLNGVQTEERFSELAKTYSKDGNASSGGIYTDVQKNSMVGEFDAWIFDESRETGDTGLVKTQYGYHVMYFIRSDREWNDWVFAENRKSGDYGIVKSDEGYHLVYYVEGEAGWQRMCRLALLEEKAQDLLQEIRDSKEISVKYGKIRLGEV